jgi:uncharacterized protein YjbI with pentapeptide repeats
MNKQATACNFKRGDQQCPHEAAQDGLCIYHTPKPTEREKLAMSPSDREQAEKTEQAFRDRFHVLLEKLENDATVESCHFEGFRFPGISFTGRTFSKPLAFSSATFSEEADFSETTFSEEADFLAATFSKKANFFAATFREEADFSETTFSKKADFAGATFSQGATFNLADFKSDAEFTNVVFGGRSHFSGDSDNCCFSGEQPCSFENLVLEPGATVTFERVNLSRVTFLDTNLELIRFFDVIWHRHGTRIALWDEFCPVEDNRDFEKIAENYRQLVINYENKRDFEMAEAFHVGEMEMRRKKRGQGIKLKILRKTREWVNVYSMYRLLSHYGTSYRRGVAVLAVLHFLFAGIFLYTGFQPTQKFLQEPVEVIEYNLLPIEGYVPVSLAQWCSDYSESLLYTLSILTFQKDRFYEPLKGWSQLWTAIAVLLFTGQAALVLFAIRRRFKR